jgi:hypothetical protein
MEVMPYPVHLKLDVDHRLGINGIGVVGSGQAVYGGTENAMIVLLPYKYRIDPKREQHWKWAVQFGHARNIFN